jgi:uncharacterized protein (TIGR03437 family)
MKALNHTALGCLFVASSLAAAPAADHVLLRYLDIGEQGAAEAFAIDGAGNVFTVSAVTEVSGRSPLRVIKTDPNGNPLASFDIDINTASQTAATAAVTDGQGNLVIAGRADSSGIPLVAPLFPSVTVTSTGAFVMKMDSQLHGILFSTLLSDSSAANGVAVDASGNIYVAGQTSSSQFPITAGAYQTEPPGENTSYGGLNRYAFLAEISPAGDHLIYSTYFGGKSVNCPFDPSVCFGRSALTSATALAITPAGAVVMAGSTSASDLPVTPAALATGCYSTTFSPAGFIAEFPAGGSKLGWSTCLNLTQTLNDYQPSVQINAVALDPSGAVVVAGDAQSGAFPTTAGVVQPTASPQDQWAGFVTKLNSTGASLIWSTYFGAGDSGVTALAVDPLGAVIITGYSDPTLLPPVPGVPLLGRTFVARISSGGTTLNNLFIGPDSSTGCALGLTPGGTFVAEGQGGSLWIESAGAGPSLLGTTNSAAGPVLGLVSPSELVSLYGIGIGPNAPVAGQVVNGTFTSSLGGYQVLFDGIAAPLLYIGPTQINTIVPHEVAGQDHTHLQIAGSAGTIDGPQLALRPAEPQIFVESQTGLAPALNEDGSLNSPQNPAKAGSITTIFATGCGALTWNDGQIVPANSVGPNPLPVSVLVPPYWTSLEVLSAGDVPGVVAGVSQITFRLPGTLPPGNTYQLQLQVGQAMSNTAALAVAP